MPKPVPAESWKDIPGYEGLYKVSDQGRVFSSRRNRELAISTRDVYVPVHLTKDGKRIAHYLHRLVLLAFVGPAPEGMECAHLNGNAHDNRLTNLQWTTPRENNLHKFAHGTAGGEKSARAKLTNDQAKEIRELYRQSGLTCKQIAFQYGVGVSAIERCVAGKTYKAAG